MTRALILLTLASASAEAATPFFQESNGAFYHYVGESGTTFASLTAKITSGYYADRGVSALAIYCPYKGSAMWRGVPAIDFFATDESTGTIADFAALTAAAHAHGMFVYVYMGLLFVDFNNPLWVKAEADYGNGVSSTETSIFRWASTDSGDVAQFGSWKHSDTANAYYAASWGHPAIDVGREPGHAYVESVLKFWLAQGVDGFEYDAPGGFWGGTTESLKRLLSDIPQAYDPTRPKYLIGEGGFANTGNEAANDDIGFNHILLSDDDDGRSLATDVMNGNLSVDELEEHFQRYLDPRRAMGRGAKSVSIYSELSAADRAFEAAVLAGNGSWMEIEYDKVYSQLSADAQNRYSAVFKALASSLAESPGAGRKRLSTTKGAGAYAVLRTNPGRQECAINIYNFSSSTQSISVALTGTGIADGAVGVDLITQASTPPIASGTYSVTLPSHGYAFVLFGHDDPPAPIASGGPHPE